MGIPQTVFNGITLKLVVMKATLPPEEEDILKMVTLKEDKSDIHPFIATGLWLDKLQWLAIG